MHSNNLDSEFHPLSLPLEIVRNATYEGEPIFDYFRKRGCVVNPQQYDSLRILLDLAVDIRSDLVSEFELEHILPPTQAEIDAGNHECLDGLLRKALCKAFSRCVRAAEAICDDDKYWADIHASDCATWMGKALGLMAAVELRDNTDHARMFAREFARAGAHARHAENRASRNEVFEWCASHLQEYPSLDSAAEAACKLVPMSFRTVREWVGLYRRRHQPTGTT